MNANVGSLDRQIRITSGIILIALVLTGVLGPWGRIGVVPLATVTCPSYCVPAMQSRGQIAQTLNSWIFFNGLLAAHWDAAFDSGLITVSTSGHVVPSAALSDSTIKVLGLSEDLCIRLQPQHEPYLAWHRERVFKQS